MVLEEVEEVVVEVVDLVVVEALVGVEEDHSRAMELQEDDDVCQPWREGEDGGGLLLRVDASLVLEPHQPSLVGNITSACPCPSHLSFLSLCSGIPLLSSLLILHESELNTYNSTFQYFLYFGGFMIETLLTGD